MHCDAFSFSKYVLIEVKLKCVIYNMKNIIKIVSTLM